jgi:hypothetical protein
MPGRGKTRLRNFSCLRQISAYESRRGPRRIQRHVRRVAKRQKLELTCAAECEVERKSLGFVEALQAERRIRHAEFLAETGNGRASWLEIRALIAER